MKNQKTKVVAALLAIWCAVLLVSGCSFDASIIDGSLPGEINELKRPVIVLACNETGLILEDANGRVLAYKSSYYFAAMMFSEGYKKGDTFLD